MAIGALYSLAEYYKPYFPDYVGKYKKFVGERLLLRTSSKNDVESIGQIIKDYNKPMEKTESVCEEGMK